MRSSALFALVSALLPSSAEATVHYVDANSTNAVSPYTNWTTAALTIQDAVDAALASDQILVRAGLYATGGHMAGSVFSRVAVTQQLTIQSVSGPDFTTIQGGSSARCAYLADGALLAGFTLSGGSAMGHSGGGVYGQSTAAWVSNCVVLGNSDCGAVGVTLVDCRLLSNTRSSGETGGAASGCILTNCTISDNSASAAGGGVGQCLLSGCLLSNNFAGWEGGGAGSSTLYDCTIACNSVQTGGGGGANLCTMNRCLVRNNSASGVVAAGGGTLDSWLFDCTLINNSATYGGGNSGGSLTNCILVGNWASQNGGGADRATLNNCSVISNSAGYYGGGTFNSGVTNCVIIGNWVPFGGGGSYAGTLQSCTLSFNSADFGAGSMGTLMFDCSILTNCASSGGGGIANCTLNSCVVMGNVATFGGGMAAYDPAPPCVLNNCTVVANYATNIGGGTYYGSVFNCVVYYNAAPVDPNIFGSSNVNNCCTLPLPGIGTGNVTNAPLFIDLAVGNLDLQPSSPCINAGSNLYVTNSADFLGRPRISGGIVDIGAYEYQFHTLDAFHAWLQQYGLPTDGSADFTDPDGDGMNNWQEWLAGTNPTNAASVLRIQAAALALQGQGIAVTWLSVSNREYFLQRSTNSVQRWEFSTIRTNIPGSQGTTTVIDTNLAALSPVFYRVGVHQ